MEENIPKIYADDILSMISKLEQDMITINASQNELLEAIRNVEEKVIDEKEYNLIKSKMDKVSHYRTKLLSLRATMSMLTGRSQQLKDRAEKLRRMKLDYLSQVEDIKRIEREKDEFIAASVSTPISYTSGKSEILLPKTKKKKKKAKARQVLLDDEDSSSSKDTAWKSPKRSLSQKDLTKQD
ncbi:hypothetical protein BDF20DRAFT_917072 [Mycotypha africana]|uniref:uncharacterized protein n=1 Tax=Mycotypha africana TaxID=64632 RepID=UPI002301A33C|nr:uncharacterized protein BDF20DRAFT_917072 [Mycotypha africana]KAI8968577.1 hypothetical protein BDF20DRAFT_917072 [Mycotypha africana]